MNLVDRLLKADAKTAEELTEAEEKSERLSKILDEEKPTAIKIREIPAKRMNDLLAMQFTSKGRFDMNKSFEAKALTVAEGVIEPDLRDQALQKHFGCATSKDLAIKLFGSEINRISDAIVDLSGLGDVGEDDEEIKN